MKRVHKNPPIYKVTNTRTGEVIIIGNSRECAEKLFITHGSFRSASYRHRHPEKYSTVRRGYNIEEMKGD